MDVQAAKDLSMILNTGALPASIKYLEERTVGPSLGADSIRSGVRAAVIGMVAVLIFMLVYYRGAGVNADIALIMNLIILLGFLGCRHAGVTCLTLPGIAGVILTVGMGVDSNVLIFERIREELRNGKTPPRPWNRALVMPGSRSSIRTSRRSFRRQFCFSLVRGRLKDLRRR